MKIHKDVYKLYCFGSVFYICISIRSHIIILVEIFPIYNNAYDCNGYEYCCYNYGNNNQTQ